MPRAARIELPRWLSSNSVAWTGALLAVLAISLAAGFIWYEDREIQKRELQGAELLARALEDQGERAFNTVDIALATLAETVRDGVRDIDPVRLGPTLARAQQGLPFLRSLSLLDANGRVLASSSIDNVDVVVDPQRVPLPSPGSIDRLGSLVAGRDLAAAATSQPAQAPGASGRNFIPLVRAVSEALQAPLYLVAALNPDYFANAYQLMLADDSRSAALFGIDGTLLAATETVKLVPGVRAAQHRFFTSYLPKRESGSFIGPGIDADGVVTAFRTLRKRPLAVVVQRDFPHVREELARIAVWVAAAGGVALLVIVTMTGMAWRSLRSFEAVHLELEAAHEHVAVRERDLRTLVESVHELIFRADASGRISFVNAGWEQITGHPGGSVLGHRLAAWCEPADRERVEALFDANAVPPDEGIMVQISTPQGELRTLEISVAPVLDGVGALHGFAGFAVDVTERQNARGRLQEQLDFTARLIDVSPTPLFVKDEQGRFVSVNRAWLSLMDLSAEQTIGSDSAELFGDDAPMHAAHDHGLLLSEDRISYDNRLVRPGRAPRDTVVTKVRFSHADGTSAGIIGSIIDVTEFREAERVTREARDAAERANRAKSDFIANISHELRTPLQAIIGFSEMGRELAPDQPEFEEMFADIHAGGKRMLTLVNGLLDVAKIESTVGSLTLERRDVATLVGQVVKEVRPLAVKRELGIAVAAPPRPLAADVDPFRIQQVVRNVLANAIRFAPQGSRIEVDCLDHGAEGVEISVRDHGPGIPTAELETIFDPFVQSSRTRDGSGGTGLGLTICRKIMGAHGGCIEAANAADGGALLRIRLPASALLPAESAMPRPASADSAGELQPAVATC